MYTVWVYVNLENFRTLACGRGCQVVIRYGTCRRSPSTYQINRPRRTPPFSPTRSSGKYDPTAHPLRRPGIVFLYLTFLFSTFLVSHATRSAPASSCTHQSYVPNMLFATLCRPSRLCDSTILRSVYMLGYSAWSSILSSGRDYGDWKKLEASKGMLVV